MRYREHAKAFVGLSVAAADRFREWLEHHSKAKKHHSSVTKKMIHSHSYSAHKHALKHHHGSFTKQKEMPESKGNDFHTELNKEYHTIVVKDKEPKHIGPPNNLFWNSCNVYIGAQGGSRMNQFLSLNTTPQWLSSSGSSFNSGQAYTAWFDLNYNRYITGSSLYGAVLPSADSFILKKSLCTIDIANMASISSIVKVHVYECLKPTADTPVVSWATQDGLAALGVSSWVPPVVGGAGAATLGSGANTSLDTTPFKTAIDFMVGARPDLTIGVKSFWKKLRTYSIDMAAASNHRITLNVIHNYVARRNYLTEQNSNYTKGSLVFYLEQTGQVVKSLDTGTVAYHASGEIGVIANVRSVFHAVKSTSARLYTNVTTSHEAVNNTVQPKLVNIVDVLANPQLE